MSETHKERSHHTEHAPDTTLSDYIAGLIADEAPHREEERYQDQSDEGGPFRSMEAEEEFKSIIRRSNMLPPERTEQILNHINRKTMTELYTFTVDREYLRESLKDESPQLSEYLDELEAGTSRDETHVSELLSSSRNKGHILACAFAAAYPDYRERMAKLRELIKTKDK